MAKELKPYKLFAELSLKQLGVSKKEYNLFLDRVKLAYIDLRIRIYRQGESRREFIQRSVVEAKTNRIYFKAITNYLLDWNYNHGGKHCVQRLIEIPYLYMDKIIAKHYPKRFPQPSQLLPQNCVDRWELYWADDERRYQTVTKQVVVSKAKKLTSKEKRNKTKYGFKKITDLEKRLMHPEGFDLSRKELERLKDVHSKWKRTRRRHRRKKQARLEENSFWEQVRFENQYSRQLYHVFIHVKNQHRKGTTKVKELVSMFDEVTIVAIRRWVRWKFNKEKLKDWNPSRARLMRMYNKYSHHHEDGKWLLVKKDLDDKKI